MEENFYAIMGWHTLNPGFPTKGYAYYLAILLSSYKKYWNDFNKLKYISMKSRNQLINLFLKEWNPWIKC